MEGINGINFPLLSSNDIEVRVSSVNKKGLSVLLYKDARCDMRILDQTVGAGNWQRRHYECKGNLFCSVGVKVDDEWIWKDDCGAESYTSKEKGEASDSFKRACFNWGIGRELYTAPFIWIKDAKINDKNGKFTCFDKFYVNRIAVNKNRQIYKLSIWNNNGGCVFDWHDENLDDGAEPVRCEVCGEVIKSAEGKAVRTIATGTKEAAGQVMCVSCFRKWQIEEKSKPAVKKVTSA